MLQLKTLTKYTNTIICAIDYLNEHDLDEYLFATNTPGGSAFNRVEKRMSNLSKDNKDNTVDQELELKNFEHAGEILAELCSKLFFSDHLVVAEFVGEDPSDITITKLEE